MIGVRLWMRWSLHELQAELERRHSGLFEQLDELLPALADVELGPGGLYSRQSLARLVDAFLPADCFKSEAFRRFCFDRLTETEVQELAIAASVDASGAFADVATRLAHKRWTPSFSSQVVAHLGLSRRFIAPIVVDAPSVENLEPPSPANPVAVQAPFKQLKDYQFDVYLDAMNQLTIPRQRFILQMPTGSGKTRTAMEIICAKLNGTNKQVTILWLAHSEELCEQASQCFLEVWSHLGARSLRFARFWGGHNPPLDSAGTALMIVGGFAKLVSTMNRAPDLLEPLRKHLALVVVDEAHMVRAPTYNELIMHLNTDSNQVVGLTATPGRSDERESDALAQFFFGQKVTPRAAAGTSVIRLLKERKVLSLADYVPLTVDHHGADGVALTERERAIMKTVLDVPEAVLARLGRHHARNIEIVRRLTMECNSGARVLFFACSVPHSRYITSLLLYLGFAAAHVDGETERSFRAATIDEFRRGGVQVLCNYGVLSTGFDAPNTDVVFVSRPTSSAVLYSQMIGRGLRGPAIGGTARCTVIDVRDNIADFGDLEVLYERFDEYYD